MKSESYYNKEESFILTSVNAESAGPKISHDTYCWFTFKYLTQKPDDYKTTMGDYFKHIESRQMILGENSNNNDSVVVMSTKKGFKTYG